MAINKFYKEFAGNKAAFVTKGYDVTYNDHICIIKDTANNGAGACIYTRGQYFGNFQELISALAFVKGVKVGADSYNAANGGGYVEFAVTDPSKVTLDVQNGKLTFGLTEAFVKSVNDVIAQSATIAGDYLKAADRTALEQLVANTKSEILGNASTDTQDSKTIEGVRKYVDAKTADIASGEAFGTLKGRVDVIEGDYLKATDKTELQNAINTEKGRIDTIAGDYLTSADRTELQNGVNANAAAIGVLEGSDKGKSAREIVQDEVANQLKSENISESFDTLKEMAEYLSSHPQDVTEINAAIKQNADDIDAIEAVIPTLATDANAQQYAANAQAAAIADAEGKISAAIAAEVSRADAAYDAKNAAANALAEAKTYAEGEADAAETAAKSYADGLAVNYATAAQGTKADAAAPQATTYTKAEVDAMFAWEVLA